MKFWGHISAEFVGISLYNALGSLARPMRHQKQPFAYGVLNPITLAFLGRARGEKTIDGFADTKPSGFCLAPSRASITIHEPRITIQVLCLMLRVSGFVFWEVCAGAILYAFRIQMLRYIKAKMSLLVPLDARSAISWGI